MTTLLAVAAILACLVVYKLARFSRRVNTEAAAAHADYVSRRAAEEETLEFAEWIGRTGLDEATERELPRYLRREFGEFLDDPDGLKASDLQYMGVFRDEEGTAHFWKVPSKTAQEPYFAYVDIDEHGEATCLGWGSRMPPAKSAV
jgi:hypothetical protein